MPEGPVLYRDFNCVEEIDAAYDPVRKITDPQAASQHFADQSRYAQEHLPCVLGVPYGPTLDETLDIFPADQPNAPVFVFIHGGYWRARASGDFSSVALGPHALGMTVVVVNYALCPKVSIDEITRQTRASLAWVVRNIAAHHGDPARILLGGHSAGANLAAMCLQTRWTEDYGLDNDWIKAAILVSGIYDIAPLRHSYLQPLIQLDEGIIRRNSPMFGVTARTAPLLITWGGLESSEFARQSHCFHTAWQSVGNCSELLEQADAHHMTAIHGFEHAQSALCQWLQAHITQS